MGYSLNEDAGGTDNWPVSLAYPGGDRDAGQAGD
jgi:hypothetical protein